MNERQKEIYEDIIERRGPQNPLTKSQKKHLKKVAKKREKSEKRKQAQEEHRLFSGKVIKPNSSEFTPEFTQEAATRYLEVIVEAANQGNSLLVTRQYRSRILELILRWKGPRDFKYSFFKGLLEHYWDYGKVQEYIESNLVSTG